MDIITQGILGAAVGQAGYQNRLGKKAVLWGAIIGLLPDLDILARLFSNPYAEMLHHRGLTHSLFFAPIVAPLLGYFLYLFYKREFAFGHWAGLAFWALLTHPLLDLFTTYGTQLLYPISTHRFSLNGVAVVDPFYSIPLLLAILLGLALWRRPRTTKVISGGALLLTTSYLFFGVAQNQVALSFVRGQLSYEGISYTRLDSYPTLFQPFLRRIVVHVKDEVWIGYVSTHEGRLDVKPDLFNISWNKHKQAGAKLCDSIRRTEVGKIFEWFTDGQISYVEKDNKICMMDSRFGLCGANVLGIWGYEAKILENDPMSKFAVLDSPEHILTRTKLDGGQAKELMRLIFGGVYWGGNTILSEEGHRRSRESETRSWCSRYGCSVHVRWLLSLCPPDTGDGPTDYEYIKARP